MKKIYKLLIVVSIISIILIGCENGHENELRVPTSSSDFVGENYQEVMTELQDAGFNNIETDVLDDLIIGGLTKDGEVEQVEIDGDTSFITSSSYQEDVKIVITYHTFTEEDDVNFEILNEEDVRILRL